MRSFAISLSGRWYVLPVLLCGSGAACGATCQDADAAHFYVSISGSETASGTTKTTPVKTLAKAIGLAKEALAKQASLACINMTQGRFDEDAAVEIPAGIAVDGGWNSNAPDPFTRQQAFTERQLIDVKADEALCSSHTCVTASKSERAVTVNGSGVSLSQLVIIGPDRHAVYGSSTFGLVVDGVDVDLNAVVIIGGTAGDGRNGDVGETRTGSCVTGGSGGYVGVYTAGGQWCHINDAGAGTDVNMNGRVIKGGPAGGSGKSNCADTEGGYVITEDLPRGDRGGAGGNGVEGRPGTATDPDPGYFTRTAGVLQWTSDVRGGHGEDGTHGASGGGGGVGGSEKVFCINHWDPVGAAGGRGRDGSAGGCGGGGGRGGLIGGAAFALVVNAGKVRANGLVLFGGQGGKGGVGGAGGHGSKGQDDATQGAAGTDLGTGCGSRHAGTGGAGGASGNGAAGGGAAGGNGGPSVAVVRLGAGTLVTAGVFRAEGGQPGAAGEGGHSGDTQVAAPSGHPGVQKDELVLTLRTTAATAQHRPVSPDSIARCE